MAAVTRTTTVAEATPRFAILGATSYAATEAGVDVSIDTAVEDKYAYVIVRWVDANNYAFLKLHLSAASDTMWLGVVVAGVETLIGTAETRIDAGAFYSMRVVAFASGNIFGALLGSTGGTLHSLGARHSSLVTGAALDDGKPGFADQSNGTQAATRTYDRFYAATPPAEPIALHSGQSLEVRHDTTLRKDSTGTYAGAPPEYVGARFTIPNAGEPGRKARFAITATWRRRPTTTSRTARRSPCTARQGISSCHGPSRTRSRACRGRPADPSGPAGRWRPSRPSLRWRPAGRRVRPAPVAHGWRRGSSR